MVERRLIIAGALLALAACAPGPATESDAAAPSDAANSGAVEQVAVACTPSENMPVEGRASPYDSTTFTLNGQRSLVCYGRPSMRERTIFGGLVPYGELWRTGANEPTIVHLPVAASIAGIDLQPGSYSLYSVPGEQEWSIVVNGSTAQWGVENQYASVEAEEIGRAPVPAESTAGPVEMFEIRAEQQGDAEATLILEWENARVRVPVRAQ